MTAIDHHLRGVVLPALRDYWAAEGALSGAAEQGDSAANRHGRSEAMRRARTALIHAGLPELTGEYLVLEHAGRFPAQVVAKARARLSAHGVTPP